MAAKNAKKPRPNKNSDGQDKKPSVTRTVHNDPGKPPEAPQPPGAPPPGTVNPATHPNLSASQQSPPGGQLPTQRQKRETVQFKDLNPTLQSQYAEKMGLDPFAPVRQVQDGVNGALQGGPTQGPIPNMLAGPNVPEGVESFPDDFAALTTLMRQGYAPGASGQEHEFAQNAESMARARVEAFENAQEGTGAPAAPMAAPPSPMGAAPAPPPQAGLAPGIPPAPEMAQGMPPEMSSSMGAPPQQPGAPGGIPPAAIAALLAEAKRKRSIG